MISSEFTAKKSEPIYRQIASFFQDKIKRGELQPGDAILSTQELAREFNVAIQTAQNALKEMSSRGLVTRVPHRGTFVSHNMDNQTIAVVSGRNLLCQPDMLGYSRISLETINYLRIKGWSSKLYISSGNDYEKGIIADLERDISSGVIRAIIVVSTSSYLIKWLTENCKIPWVGIGGKTNNEYHNILITKGLSYLHSQSYRKIVLVMSDFVKKNREIVQQIVEDFKLKHEDKISVELWNAEKNYPQDGFKATQEHLCRTTERPEAIFVIDDNLCHGVLMGLLEHGIKIPDDIALLSHANKGVDILSPVPLTVIENDLSLIAAGSVENLLALLDGRQEAPIGPTMKLIKGKSC